MDKTDYTEARKNATQFLALTSIYPNELDVIIPKYRDAIKTKLEAEGKSISETRGRPAKLKSPEERLFFILSYMKNYPLQQLFAKSYGVCQSTISSWVRKETELLGMALAKFSPSRNGEDIKMQIEKFRTFHENSQKSHDEPILIDATERQIPRPIDDETQKIYYSGKARRHTLKVVIVVLAGVIIGMSFCVEGKRHDKKVTQEQNYKVPEGMNIIADLGMLGLLISGAKLKLPHKKPKGGQLTEIQKIENKAISKIRVAVEHAIRCIKRMHIAKSILRSRWEGMDDASLIVPAALHNFRNSLRCPTAWN